MKMTINDTKKLNNGLEIPYLGLGVFRSPEGPETANAVRWAVEAGYKHIDTARIYRNEKSVGEGIRTCGLAREKLFITTKLWNDDMRKNRHEKAFEESLADLELDYVDLYLIHWPVENYLESWTEMEKILASGRTRAIGVSNFQIHHLEALLNQAKVVPAVNQYEIHPRLTQYPLGEFCLSKGIAVEAYSPLGGQDSNLIEDVVLKLIAVKYKKTTAQIMLRWDLQRGIITIPKSIHKERIKENCNLYDFTLAEDDMRAIDKLNQDQRVGADPDNFPF